MFLSFLVYIKYISSIKHRIEEEKEHLEVLYKLNGLVMSSHLRIMEKVDKSARKRLEELKEKEKKDN